MAESLSLRRQLGDRRGLISLLVPLGFWFQTDYDRARSWLEEAVTLACEFSEKLGLTYSLRNLALVEYRRGNDERALALWEESLAVALELKGKLGIAECLSGFAALAALSNQLERAACLFGAAQKLRHDIAAPQPPTERVDVERRIAGVRHLLGDQALNAAWAAGQALTAEQAAMEALATPPRA